MPRAPLLMATICAAMAVAACDPPVAEEMTASDWEVIESDWAWGPEIELGEDLVIPSDTYAIGPVLATHFKKFGPGDWRVMQRHVSLASTADPYDLAKAFADQSVDPPRFHPEESQLHPPKFEPQENLDKLCDQSRSSDTSRYTGELEPGAEHIECQAFAWGVDGWVLIQQDLQRPYQPVLVSIWGKDFPAPENFPAPPQGVGGPSYVPSNVEGYPDLQIVDGSFLAGPPGLVGGTGGFTAVIGVNGNPDDVFDAYVAQDKEKAEFTLDTVIDDMHVRQHQSAQAGGVWLTITLNEMDGNAWIYVSAYND